MNLLIQRLASDMPRAPDTVLVVGAGSGRTLPLLRTLKSSRLILAEAHPQQAEELAKRVNAHANEEVWPMAIVAMPSPHANLHVLNNPLWSSVNPPQELFRVYPNLRVIEEIHVPCRPLSEAIATLDLRADGAHALIIDAPGHAWELLSSVPAPMLQLFVCVVVHCDTTPLYAGDRGRSDIIDLLQKTGFDVALDDPDAIHPQAAILLKRNDVRVKISALEARLSQREDEYMAQVKLGTELNVRLQQLTQEHNDQAALVNQHKAALDQATEALNQQRKSVADQQELIQKLTAERDAQAKLAGQHKSDLDKVQTALSEMHKLAEERKTLLDKVSQQSQERGARIIQLEKEHAELSQHQERLDREMVKAEAQVELIKDVLLRDRAV